jgi:hypothetical protein
MVRAHWLVFDEDAASGILADENLHEPVTDARRGNRSNESFGYEACARSGRLASGRSAARRGAEGYIPGKRCSLGHENSIRYLITTVLISTSRCGEAT